MAAEWQVLSFENRKVSGSNPDPPHLTTAHNKSPDPVILKYGSNAANTFLYRDSSIFKTNRLKSESLV